MALFEKTLGGILVGFAAGMLGPSLFSSAGSVLRPIAKGLIAGGLSASDRVKGLAAEAREQMNDLVAEVQSENGSMRNGGTATPQPKHKHAD